MSHFIKYISTTLFIFFLYSCKAGYKTISINDKEISDKNNGGIIFSMTSNSYYITTEAYVKSKASDKSGYAATLVSGPMGALAKSFDDANDFDELVGRVLFVELEPGNYKLDKWEVKLNELESIVPMKYPEQVPFTVKKGEISYIGNIHVERLKNKSILPVINDYYARDIEMFRKKYINLSSKAVSKQVNYTGTWFPK